jgi:hypothetical protein
MYCEYCPTAVACGYFLQFFLPCHGLELKQPACKRLLVAQLMGKLHFIHSDAERISIASVHTSPVCPCCGVLCCVSLQVSLSQFGDINALRTASKATNVTESAGLTTELQVDCVADAAVGPTAPTYEGAYLQAMSQPRPAVKRSKMIATLQMSDGVDKNYQMTSLETEVTVTSASAPSTPTGSRGADMFGLGSEGSGSSLLCAPSAPSSPSGYAVPLLHNFNSGRSSSSGGRCNASSIASNMSAASICSSVEGGDVRRSTCRVVDRAV